MIKNLSNSLLILSAILLFVGCGPTTMVTTPIANIDTTPLKLADLTKAEKQNWGHLDLVSDTIPGMSVDKAYKELIGTKKGNKIIVAVLDSGMDLKHEDLDGVLWTNTKEKPGDGIDNDGNGYIDDIHGYNFLGESYNEQLEMARILRLGLGDAALQAKAKSAVEERSTEALQNKQNYEQYLQFAKNAHKALSQELGKEDYTLEEVNQIKPATETMQQSVGVANQIYGFADDLPSFIKDISKAIDGVADMMNYNLKVDFNGREIVGDNPYDITDTKYGDGNPQSRSEDESHGTHVAGIIGAERNNGKGVNGIANNVAIMSLRAVPNGDEYDKDIALGIRYAVDNGAKIINGSFGKSFSPKAEWVYDAIKYAASKGVLFVHAAGNDGANLDDPNEPNFPNDQVNNGPEISDNVITVGALAPKYGSEMLAGFSNYGDINVDVFAPGGDIYSTVPGSKYEFNSGTSMAAPGVAGVAALVWSQYPKLTASQVKKIILQSGLEPKTKVVLGGDTSKTASLADVSISGKMVNAYNALVMAEAVSKGQIKL